MGANSTLVKSPLHSPDFRISLRLEDSGSRIRHSLKFNARLHPFHLRLYLLAPPALQNEHANAT